MKPFITEKNSQYDKVFLAVAMISALEILFHVYVGLRGIGKVAFQNYLPIVMSIFMYLSIIKYMVRYFKKGMDTSMEDMLFRFGMSSLTALIGLKEGNFIVFVCTAIMVFVVPNIIGGWKNTKKQIISLFVVLFCAVVAAFVNITQPTEKYLSFMGNWVYILDALNQVIQWSLFCILIFVRARLMRKQREEKA